MSTTPNNGKRKTLMNTPMGMVLKALLEGKHNGKLTSGGVITIMLLGWYGYQEYKKTVDGVIEDTRQKMEQELEEARDQMYGQMEAQLETAREEWQAEVAELKLQTINEVKRIYDEVGEAHPEMANSHVEVGEVEVKSGAGGSSKPASASKSTDMMAQIEEAPELSVKVKSILKEKVEKGEVKKFLLDEVSPREN